MDILKWLLNASLVVAFMFLGLKAQPKPENPDNDKSEKTVIISLFG